MNYKLRKKITEIFVSSFNNNKNNNKKKKATTPKAKQNDKQNVKLKIVKCRNQYLLGLN